MYFVIYSLIIVIELRINKTPTPAFLQDEAYFCEFNM